MWEWVKGFWNSLSEVQRTIIIAAGAVIAIGILGSFIFLGTDYSGFGEFIKGMLGGGSA
jgi:flagellar biosynthesis/type III secretory pathway M-ring protein FliF/YscJ